MKLKGNVICTLMLALLSKVYVLRSTLHTNCMIHLCLLIHIWYLRSYTPLNFFYKRNNSIFNLSLRQVKIDVRIELMLHKISSLYIATQNKNHKSYQNYKICHYCLKIPWTCVVTRLIFSYHIFFMIRAIL